ncbi:MAG: YoaK family protein [Neisseria sp.]|nr:YoaK family protein [Neisseria sp.]
MSEIRRTAKRRKTASPPFWQADKPYLDDCHISDARFRVLGYIMAFLAGAINAGGFFAVKQYTSHVSGSMSHAADAAFLGEWQDFLIAMSGVVCFILGAAHANWTVLWAKRRRFRSGYGLSLWLEAVYLLIFGLLGVGMSRFGAMFAPPTLMLLCFIMGMHNTVMTVLSGGAIRSTHMTGTATDLGIELSKILYYTRTNNPRLPSVRVNRPKSKLLVGLLLSFLGGGIVGAWGYHQVAYHFTLPVAAILFWFGIGSVGYDFRIRLRTYLWRKSTRKRNQK